MVRRYQDSDFEQIASWGKAWGAEYDKESLPPLGFIYPGVCAYFIYETKSNVCFLENMIKNPEINSEISNLALTAVVTEVLKEVKRLGYKTAYATTDNQKVVERAIQHKAVAKSEQTLLCLKFK